MQTQRPLLSRPAASLGSPADGRDASFSPPPQLVAENFPAPPLVRNDNAFQLPSISTMNTLRRLSLSLLLALLATLATQAHAQRESFEATTVRIIKSEDIVHHFPQSAPEKSRQSRGLDIHGNLIVIITTELALTFENDVFFKFDSTKLRNKSSEEQLKEMLASLKSEKLRDRLFLIEGHTCDIGTEDYNYKLSLARAQAIKGYLVDHGIAPERLAVLGCGASDPLVKIDPRGTPAEIEAWRSRNRRVVLRQLPFPAGHRK